MKPGLTPSVLVLVSTAGMQRSTSCCVLVTTGMENGFIFLQYSYG